MRRLIAVCCVVLPSLFLTSPFPTARGAIVIDETADDVDPADPDDWKSDTDGYVGITGHGILEVDGGSALCSAAGYVGYESDSTGEVTIDGAESTWTNSSDLFIGHSGIGKLTITDDATVGSEASDGYIGYNPGSTGIVTLDGEESLWTTGDRLYVGYSGDGTLDVTAGAYAWDYFGYIGYEPGSVGVVTVDGGGSRWRSSFRLYIGHEGSGTLNIADDASVSCGGSIYVGSEPGSSGQVNFGDGGGKLVAGTLYGSPTQFSGDGTIEVRGLVTDIDLVFDATHGLEQMLAFDSPGGGDIAIDFDIRSGAADLGVGYLGTGSLAIRDGVIVESQQGYVGYHSGSTGTVTVHGEDSKWANDSSLYLGHYGEGTLAITGGGAVSNRYSYVAFHAGSTGAITVAGAGSTWVSTMPTSLGWSGNATIDISDGAVVQHRSVTLGSEPDGRGAATVDGTDSIWICERHFVVGSYGTGELDISGDADVTCQSGYIAKQEGSTGTATVDGPGSTWTSDVTFSVGERGSGTLEVTAGATVTSCFAYVGHYSAATGVATIDGEGSKWTNTDSLYVGQYGSGTLHIRDGGVSSCEGCKLGTYEDASGTVTVDGPGSKWTNDGRLHIGWYGDGALHISDGATASTTGDCYLGYSYGTTGAVTVDGAGSKWTIDDDLYVGNSGIGTLDISGGGAVSSRGGTITYYSGSGAVTVDGEGSKWTMTDDLYVGDYRGGTLLVTGGATVSNVCGYIASGSSTSTVTIDGPGSKWTNSDDLSVGRWSFVSGILHISGGATVTATEVEIEDDSLLAIDVGYGSSLTIATGAKEIQNDGVVRILAGAGAMPGGPYSPITAKYWDGNGEYLAIGGTWDDDDHEFTVSAVQSGTSGTMAIINRALTQRVLVLDGETDWAVGASFLASEQPATLNFTATAIDLAALGDLASLLHHAESIEGAWVFTATGSGYDDHDPVYLSFDIGPGFRRSDLNVWHRDGSEWTEYDAADLTYGGRYASFTVTGLSSYAVSVVPEPGTLALLITAALALCIHARRDRN